MYKYGLFDPQPTNLATSNCFLSRERWLPLSNPPSLTIIRSCFLAGKKDSQICSLGDIIAMSRRNVPKPELKLNLSPPRISQPRVESPGRSSTVSTTSPPSSCLSSDGYSTSPEATSMMLVGCPNCLMYVMLAEEDPRCPKCKTTVLLDVIHDSTTTTTNKNLAKIGSDQKKLG